MRNKLILEAIATFTLCAASMLASAPLSVAVLMAGLIYMSGPLAAGYYNPAITVALGIRRRITWPHVFLFIGVQVAAALLASLVVSVVAVRDAEQMKDALAAVGESPFEGWASSATIEFLGTFLLSLVVLMVTTSRLTAGNSYYGIAIAAVALGLAGSFTELSPGLNPAVSLTELFRGTFGSFFTEGEKAKTILQELTLLAKLTPRVLFDITTQVAGAVAAGWLFRRMFPEEL
jgi:aquaporin Z